MDQNIEWTAEPIPPSERKAALRDQRSFAGALAKVQNEARRWSWSLAGISNVTTLAVAVVMGVALYRQKPQDPMFIVLNKMETGAAYRAIPARDAVKYFDSSDRKDDIQTYITARLGYIDVIDREQWLTVRAMSMPEQFSEYDAWRKSSLSPVKRLNTNGHINVTDWQEDPHPIQAKDGVWSYTVKFRLQEIKGHQIGPKEQWQATLSFKYIPDIKLPFEERHRNWRGFQCITFEARQP